MSTRSIRPNNNGQVNQQAKSLVSHPRQPPHQMERQDQVGSFTQKVVLGGNPLRQQTEDGIVFKAAIKGCDRLINGDEHLKSPEPDETTNLHDKGEQPSKVVDEMVVETPLSRQ
ncbi:hypothetical protein TSUD_136560 [Trifolium subterraneum]|uniref:Uncharacterized protein n=1 Tax=Trifolium subterraneum TaxID=3900 RepID=A0A2Z6P8W3_TRISU|nr:hypothetical protein TSUD_136560 [Trifolium subterraneum]